MTYRRDVTVMHISVGLHFQLTVWSSFSMPSSHPTMLLGYSGQLYLYMQAICTKCVLVHWHGLNANYKLHEFMFILNAKHLLILHRV